MTKQREITPTILALVFLIVFGLAAMDILVLARRHAQVVTRTIRVGAPDPAAQAGRAGLVAADQQYMRGQDALSRKHNAPTWTMGYIVSSATPTNGQVLNWVLTLDSGQPEWSSVSAKFAWTGRRWVAGGITFVQPLGSAPRDYDKFQPFPA